MNWDLSYDKSNDLNTYPYIENVLKGNDIFVNCVKSSAYIIYSNSAPMQLKDCLGARLTLKVYKCLTLCAHER
jgi:hypothetical protein